MAMSSTHDWINNPLGVVQEIFDASLNNVYSASAWEEKVIQFFKEQLNEKDAHIMVPSLNDVPLHYLKPNSLVKFRCFIQDMFDPEFYMGAYETLDPSSKAKIMQCGKYRDVIECSVDFNSSNAMNAERQTFYCVPIPGESPWTKEMYAGENQGRVVPSTSYAPNRQKRSYEDDEDMETYPQRESNIADHKSYWTGHSGPIKCTHSANPQSPDSHHGKADNKRQETQPPSSQPASASQLDLNFPLPGEKGPSCLVKVYEDWDSFKLNEMLEVYGILSVSPVLSALADEKETSASLLDPTDSMETAAEQRVHCPPASLVPRLHLICAKHLHHNNPLMPLRVLEENTDFLSSILSEMATVRTELLTYFTHVLLGDTLAAEYLILHLISNVYTRRDVLPLGKFTLNLSGCPTVSSYTEHLYLIIQELVPTSFYLEMTLQNMNQMRLVPKKDYIANRLVSGALQLPRNTSLFLDETRLEQGQLDTTGVHNVTALGNLITWQKVDYDFHYHQMEFPSNVNVLITSEGRSLLPSDCQIHLQSRITPSQMEDYLSSLHVHSEVSAHLNKFRIFLSVAQLLDYSVSDEVTKSIEDDFVDMRKEDPQSVSAEDLHRMLVIARLLSLSLGQTTLSRDSWMKAKHIEMQRKSRMEQQKCVNGNEP